MDQAVPTFLATTPPMCTPSTLQDQNEVFLETFRLKAVCIDVRQGAHAEHDI
jgi:hypothetical protein